jgi:hypothetical protein
MDLHIYFIKAKLSFSRKQQCHNSLFFIKYKNINKIKQKLVSERTKELYSQDAVVLADLK